MNISLFVCCHNQSIVPKHKLLKPVQVGTALSNGRFEGFLHDDEGDNISEKNRSYCELTAQYWAWKNVSADYYGFFHYRRFLYPSVSPPRRPYRIEKAPTLPLLDQLGYQYFEELIEKYDIIAPIGENMHVSVWDHYANAPYQHATDLQAVEQIIRERHPDMLLDMEKYLTDTVCYFGNIYIMRKQLFHEYCSWLFAILGEFDSLADISSYSTQEKRVDGYLAERLFGIWYTHVRSRLNVLELPRVHFVNRPFDFVKSRVSTFLLPPGSKRRHFIKEAFDSMKKHRVSY